MRLAIEDERLGDMIEAFAHQGFLHLVLDILHRDVIVDIQMADDLRDGSQISGFIHTLERLDDSIHDFVQRELGLRPVSLRDGKVFNFHCIVC